MQMMIPIKFLEPIFMCLWDSENKFYCFLGIDQWTWLGKLLITILHVSKLSSILQLLTNRFSKFQMDIFCIMDILLFPFLW